MTVERADEILAEWRDELVAAIIFLTRLPLRWPGVMPVGLHVRSMRVFPLVGAGIGAAGGAVYAGAAALDLPPSLAALLAVAAQIGLTGALHEDGLGDIADGFGGGRTPEAKLAIMRDSRLGTYGTLAVALALLARVLALAALAAPLAVLAALVASGAASRAVVPTVMRALPLARGDGLAAAQGQPSAGGAVTAALLGLVLALLAGPVTGLAALLAGAAAAAAVALLARRQIGGYTGDVLGAVQQTTEIAMLLALVAVAR